MSARQRDVTALWMSGITLLALFAMIGCASSSSVQTRQPDAISPTDITVHETTLPNTPAGALLVSWLDAHNRGDEDSITNWMRRSFSPNDLQHMSFSRRLEFYLGGVTIFGELDPEPLEVFEDDELHVTAHFVGVEIDRAGQIDPTDIIVVEVIADSDDPRYLAPGMTLTALVCEIPETDGQGVILLPGANPFLGATDALEIPDTPAGRILSSWLTAHNTGDRESLAVWVSASYSAEALEKRSAANRLQWYLDGVEMFSKRNPEPIKIVESSENRLVVWLVGDSVAATDAINLDDVLEVQVDVDPARSRYLARGLGFGPPS